MSDKFKFPSSPETDYTKVPNILFDSFSGVLTVDQLAELKVILFILRHTWGFQEYHRPKKITIDEFRNGRKRKDGTRMGPGCACSANSIRKGIELAIEHGFIIMTENRTDKARVKRYFRLNTEDKSQGSKKRTDDTQESTLEIQPLTTDTSMIEQCAVKLCTPINQRLNTDQRKKPIRRKLIRKKLIERKQVCSIDQNSLSSEFREWYQLYPRKVGRRKAEQCFASALKRIIKDKGIDKTAALALLSEKTKLYAKSVSGEDTKYIKHPATWLNGDCWDDELTIDKNGKAGSNGQSTLWWQRPFEKIPYRDRELYEEKMAEARLKINNQWDKERRKIPLGTIIHAGVHLNRIAVELGFPGFDRKYWPCHIDYCGSSYTTDAK